MRKKWFQKISPLKSNSVVLISDDGLPRNKWILGKVENTYPGKDGLIRTASIRTKKGVLYRPIQKLHLLEEYRESLPSQLLPGVREESHNAEEQSQSIQNKNGNLPLVGEDVRIPERRSRYGRLIKPVKQ